MLNHLIVKRNEKFTENYYLKLKILLSTCIKKLVKKNVLLVDDRLEDETLVKKTNGYTHLLYEYDDKGVNS